jgi:hypothetical protein
MKAIKVSPARNIATNCFNPFRLLLAAAIFHLAVTTIVFGIGRGRILPGTFDTNGIAISFAPNGVGYHKDAIILGDFLRNAEFADWFAASEPLHVKLYSVVFAVFGGLFGYNILSAEPLNLFYYLGILIFTYKVARETLSPPAGLIAALIVALWPSFLLHTTQLLKDPIFILGMLVLVFIMVRLLGQIYSWRHALLQGLIGAALATTLWKARSDMGIVLVTTIALGAAIIVLRQFQVKRFWPANIVGMALMIVLMAAGMLLLPAYSAPDHSRLHAASDAPVADLVKARPSASSWQIAAQIRIVRQRFIAMYPTSSSNIDSDVKLETNAELVRYLPRAAAIGFFAPFPNTWFETGNSVGATGRLLSGLETILMYGVEVLAVIGIWQGRRRLSVWLLFSIVTMGAVALGLVVVNVGTLFRLRYFFLVLLIILAAGGIAHVFATFSKWRSLRTQYNAKLNNGAAGMPRG